MYARHSLRIPSVLLGVVFSFVTLSIAQQVQQAHSGWPSYGHDEHHTGVSSRGAQRIKTIHWSTKVDLTQNGGFVGSHFGSPLATPANTTIVSVKTGSNSFRVEAHNGADGKLIWQQNTDYTAPGADFAPGMYPVLDHNRVIIPAAGGTILVRQNPDQASGQVTRAAC